MYGLINRAIKEMVTDHYGEPTWNTVLEKSGAPGEAFLTLRRNEDAVTYQLAASAADVLGISLEACLEAFGEYWVLETAAKSYGTIMDAAGNNPLSFLGNLNSMHDRITTTFPGYLAPEFELEPGEGDRQLVHYLSVREGLNPFVVGLLRGIAKRFGRELNLHNIESVPTESGTHTVFEVSFS
jgi:guanylate cyclase soluble subunit beta